MYHIKGIKTVQEPNRTTNNIIHLCALNWENVEKNKIWTIISINRVRN